MRLIVKDYLLRLKEKDELDLLLIDLFTEEGYVSHTIPKCGNRQYGVDAKLQNDSQIKLLLIKQGNITRKVWDTGPNSVRQSLNEIHDIYLLSLLAQKEVKKEIEIILATNGTMDEPVELNWNGYIKIHSKFNGRDIKYKFLGIDEIVAKVLRYYFNEKLFNDEVRSLLRKALYFIEENNYINNYFESLIDMILKNIKIKKDKEFEKQMSALRLSCEMIRYYADLYGMQKISVEVSEYLLIKYWHFLKVHELFEIEKYVNWLLLFEKDYEKYALKYFDSIRQICCDRNLFPRYNLEERKIILYEVVSFLASFVLFLNDHIDLDSYYKEKRDLVLNNLISLINNYDYMYLPLFDKDIGIIVMIFTLLLTLGRKEELSDYINTLCIYNLKNYVHHNKFPSPNDDFEEALKINMRLEKVEYPFSAFWGYILLWIGYQDLESVYNIIQDFLNTKLKKVTKCLWLISSDEEEAMYYKNAMYCSGTGIELIAGNDYEELKKHVTLILKNYKTESFSFDKYSFPSLKYIICRYYKHIPFL